MFYAVRVSNTNHAIGSEELGKALDELGLSGVNQASQTYSNESLPLRVDVRDFAVSM